MGQQGTFWTVDPGDTIYSIATKLSFMDGGQALWNANPDIQTKSNNNPDVLSPGWVLKIPQPDQKTEGGMPVAQQHQFQLPGSHRKLVLNFRDQDGQPIQDWQYRFQVDSIMKESGDISNSRVTIDFDADSLQEETLKNVVIQAMKGQQQDPTSVLDSIQLTVGGLDPIVDGLPGRIAIQKILTNLGLFQGTIDGNFGIDTVAAIASFQCSNHLTIDGSASPETVQGLVSALGNIIAVTPLTDPQTASDPRDRPLGVGTEASTVSVGGRTLGNTYLEPPTKTAADKKTRLPMEPFHLFPPAAYVAPCDKSTPDDNRNIIQMPLRKFVFLDTGRWYNKGRDFGLIFGRHVYLCTFSGLTPPAQSAAPSPSTDPGQSAAQSPSTDPGQSTDPGPRLDKIFFDGMGTCVTPVNYCCITWAPPTDFDWDTLYLIIPDLHLMDGTTGGIWLSQPTYDLHAEVDLLSFVSKLIGIEALHDKLKPMQIGDCYDLWVGGQAHGATTALFTENDQCQMQVVKDADGTSTSAYLTLSNWIKEIRGLNTPWVSGLLNDKRAQIFWAQYNCTLLQNFIDEPDATITEVAKRIRDGILPQYQVYVEDLSQNTAFSGPYPWMFSDSSDGSLDSSNVHQGLDALQQYTQQALLGAGPASVTEQYLFDQTNWLNPAEKALQLLATTFATKGMVYFYGNHDNYLLDDALCAQAGIPTREPFLDLPGFLIEHVHRLEATFSSLGGGGHNYDGTAAGYNITNSRWDGLYKPFTDYFAQAAVQFGDGKILNGFWSGIVGIFKFAKNQITGIGAAVTLADNYAELHDQQAYVEEYVDLWLGRFSNAGVTAVNSGTSPSDPSASGTDPSQGATSTPATDPSQGTGSPSGGASPPHLFVIGHTHCPKLQYITIASTPNTKIEDIAVGIVEAPALLATDVFDAVTALANWLTEPISSNSN